MNSQTDRPLDVLGKPSDGGRQSVNPEMHSAHPVMEQDLVFRVAELPWLRYVEMDDVRLGYTPATSLGMWLFDRQQEGAGSSIVHEVIQRIEAVNAMTFAQELVDVVVHAVDKTKANRDQETIERWSRIFVSRFLSPTGRGRELRDVGNLFGCSPQRVSQICERVLEELRSKSFVLPALWRVLIETQRLAPCGTSECNDALRQFLGPDVGIESVLSVADALDRNESALSVKVTKVMIGRVNTGVAAVVQQSSESWIVEAVRFARHDCSLLGCTSVQRLAGYLSLELGRAPGRRAIELEVQNLPGFVWLAEEGRWFTIGDRGTSSALAERVLKVMAVATKAVELSEIGTALITDTRWLSRIGVASREREASLPALHVLQALMTNWDWLRQVQYTRFEPVKKIAADVLTEAEKRVVTLISEHDGVACTHEIASDLEREFGMAVPTVSNLLSASPIIKKLEYSTYAVRGMEIGDTALEKARLRNVTGRT